MSDDQKVYLDGLNHLSLGGVISDESRLDTAWYGLTAEEVAEVHASLAPDWLTAAPPVGDTALHGS